MFPKIIIFFLYFLFSTNAFATKSVHWNLAVAVPSTFAPLSSPSFKIARLVKEMSNGRFLIKVDGREKIESTQSIQSLVEKHNYDMGHTFSKNSEQTDINTLWFTGTPFGLTPKEQYAWFYYGDGAKYMSQVYEPYGLLAFPGGSLGTQMFGWSNTKINTIDDFKGFSMVATGLTAEILSLHGVSLKKIAFNEQREALKEKKIDIIRGISPSIDIKMEFHKNASYYYKSWDRPSLSMQFIINKKAFVSLPKHYQSILQTAIKTVAADLESENFYTSANAMDKISQEYPNLEILSLSTEIIESLQKSTTNVFEHYAKENPLFKEIYESQQKFLKSSRKWTTASEYSLIQK